MDTALFVSYNSYAAYYTYVKYQGYMGQNVMAGHARNFKRKRYILSQ